MNNQASAGDTCTITREITVGGKIAFQKGEWVKVERVEPDPQRPEYKYVVMSSFLQNKLKLTDADLAVQSRTQPTSLAPGADPLSQMKAPGAAFPPPMRPPGAGGIERPKAGGFRSSQAFLPVVLVVAIVVIVAAFGAIYFVTQGGEEVEVGWKVFKNGGVHISLPDSYVGGGSDELDTLVDGMKSLWPEYGDMAEAIGNSDPDTFCLLAYDSEASTAGMTFVTVNVADDKSVSEMDLELVVLDITESARESEEMFPEEIRVETMGIALIGEHEAARWTIEGKGMGGTSNKQIGYVIKDGKTMCVILFTTSVSEFDKRLPDFEKSIESIGY